MGDIISGIFGSSTATEQETVPDVVQQEMNRQRLNQIVNLFQSGALNQFGGAANAEYTPTSLTGDLISTARNEILDRPLNYDNRISLNDYISRFAPVTANYDRSVSDIDRLTGQGLQGNEADYAKLQGNLRGLTQGALSRSYADYGTGVWGAKEAYGTTLNDTRSAYNSAIQRGDYDLARSIQLSESNANRALAGNQENFQGGVNTNEANLLRSLGISGADAQRSLATQDANRARALELGIGATGNYVDQIARPRLEQVMALQGLERGGALPASIARAVAEQAMPYLQGIENTYGTNQANTLNSLMGLRGTLTNDASSRDAALRQQLMQLQTGIASERGQQQVGASEAAASGNRALGSQLLGATAQAGNTYQGNIAQLAQALMNNNITLEQAGIGAESALGQQLVNAQNALRLQQQSSRTSLSNTYGTNASNFTQSLPAASAAISLLPGQMQGQRAVTLTALQPLADFPRQLAEADLLRRQGLFTTAYTGIPFQAGSTTFGGSATGNIFDQLGGTIQSGFTGGGNIGGT